MKNPTSRFLALLTVSALSATALLHPVPAHASKAKTYKYGAIALGVAGGYLLSKGKTVAGAAVLGAGAYTYKKGEDARKAEKNDRYGYNSGDRYGQRYNNGRYDNGQYNNGSYNNGGYDNGRYNNGSYNNGGYDDGRYDSRYDSRYPTNTNGNTNNSNGTYRAYNGRDRDDLRLR